MAVSAKTSDRFGFGLLYVLVGLLTLWAGFRVIDRSLELRFFKDFLIQWDVGIKTFSARQGPWPAFSGHNHVAYMDALVQKMSRTGIRVPDSNTSAAYRYRIERFSGSTEKIFILCLHDRIVLYGLSSDSARRIDRAVDRIPDLDKGAFRGHPGKDKTTFIGYWQL